MQLDELDRKTAEAFDGYLVRKDLVRQFARQFSVPTYVVEFLLGRYCATTDENEIKDGLEIVQRQLSERTVRAGNEELIKSTARENGQVKIIDIVSARLDAKTDSYVAELPSLKLRDVRISAEQVNQHQRMLTGGFYVEVTLGYNSTIAVEKGGWPFAMEGLRAIQLSRNDVLDVMAAARSRFTSAEWKDLLLRSVGLEPAELTERAKDAMLLRMVPFVERNYNMVEIGPRGTGKSHLFQQVSPYAHLVSGGKATVARMFVNMSNGQRGLVCQYDVVCFDEVSGISFDDKHGVNIFLSECFTHLRSQSRVAAMQGRVFFGGALSGRDSNGVNKTASGLLKLMSPSAEATVSDEDLEWAVRLALEVRGRVKEQQERIGAAEFSNTHFSYTLGADGVEKFVSTSFRNRSVARSRTCMPRR